MAKYYRFLLIFLCAGILEQVEMAKRKKTTPAPFVAAEEEETPSPDNNPPTGDAEAVDHDEMTKYMTPECLETLQKNQDLLKAVQADPSSQEKAEELLTIMMKGGCKPILDHMMKKQMKKE